MRSMSFLDPSSNKNETHIYPLSLDIVISSKVGSTSSQNQNY